MVFTALPIPGAFIVDIEPKADERGVFARTFCEREFAQNGLASRFVQCSTSYNISRGTLRGLHYQVDPHSETKLVRCTAGAIYDVIVDLRRDAGMFGRWAAVELTAENRRSLHVPAGVAHGFQTTADGSEVFYQISGFYHAESARGIRWNDPRLQIEWPVLPPILSDGDANYPDLA